jgi:hypothetical protein
MKVGEVVTDEEAKALVEKIGDAAAVASTDCEVVPLPKMVELSIRVPAVVLIIVANAARNGHLAMGFPINPEVAEFIDEMSRLGRDAYK